VKAGALHVLYVEDDPMLRDMLATQLRAHRRIADIEAFGSPREAIDGAGLGLVVSPAVSRSGLRSAPRVGISRS
jgi:hypothetical protein